MKRASVALLCGRLCAQIAKNMKLRINGKKYVDNPSPEEIAKELTRISLERNSYAFLQNDNGSYIEAFGKKRTGFILEYVDNSDAENTYLKSSASTLMLEQIITAFTIVARRRPISDANIQWHRIQGNKKSLSVTKLSTIIYLWTLIVTSYATAYLKKYNLHWTVPPFIILLGWVLFIRYYGVELWNALGRMRTNAGSHSDSTFLM